MCSDVDFVAELAYLKAKVDAGANIIVTQMFFDVEVYLSFVDACRAAGIKVPIVPGIMCITACAPPTLFELQLPPTQPIRSRALALPYSPTDLPAASTPSLPPEHAPSPTTAGGAEL